MDWMQPAQRERAYLDRMSRYDADQHSFRNKRQFEVTKGVARRKREGGRPEDIYRGLENEFGCAIVSFQPRGITSPELRLVEEMLRDVVEILHRGDRSGEYAGEYEEAREWVMSTDTTYPYSFEPVCSYFNLDTDGVRERLLAIVPTGKAPRWGDAGHGTRSDNRYVGRNAEQPKGRLSYRYGDRRRVA